MRGFDTLIHISSLHAPDNERGPKTVSSYELSRVMSDFFNQRFKGLVKVDFDIDEIEFVSVSAECLAFFLKAIIEYIDSAYFLYIHCRHTDNRFIIELTPTRSFEFSLEKRAAFTSSAHSSGFEIDIENEKITLSTKLLTSGPKITKVYEKPSADLLHIFEEVFFN